MKKKNAKIFLSVCIVAALLLSACACAQDEGRVQESPGTNTASTKTPSPAPTEQPTPPPTQDAATQAPTERPSPAATPKVEIVSEDPVTAALYREEAAAIKSAQMLSESIAIQFYATAPFNSLQLTCPSWSNSIGTLVFDLYKWEGSFQDSFNTTLATQEFENYPDNNNNTMTFSEQPAGEYILYLTTPDPSEEVGCYIADEPYEGSAVYLDDVLQEDYSVVYLNVCYTKTPDVLSGAVHPEG